MKGEKILYGIINMNKNLDDIIASMELKDKVFEVKLILSEAITNAFIHGNSRDSSKPITVTWEMYKNNLCIRVKDCGEKKDKLILNSKKDEIDMLSENGRGLFIISEYSDEVKFEDNTIIMKKAV
ncbi:MAG: ATP-binding protein [Clostridium butyricum]|nr:ATP-binding protein [Clostridium butyricum]